MTKKSEYIYLLILIVILTYSLYNKDNNNFINNKNISLVNKDINKYREKINLLHNLKK